MEVAAPLEASVAAAEAGPLVATASEATAVAVLAASPTGAVVPKEEWEISMEPSKGGRPMSPVRGTEVTGTSKPSAGTGTPGSPVKGLTGWWGESHCRNYWL